MSQLKNKEKYKNYINFVKKFEMIINNNSHGEKNNNSHGEKNNNSSVYSNMTTNNEIDYQIFVDYLETITLSLNKITKLTFEIFHNKFPKFNINENHFNIFKESYLSSLNTNNLQLNNITFNKFTKKYPEFNITKNDFNTFKELYIMNLSRMNNSSNSL
jgi:hypothetical protein